MIFDEMPKSAEKITFDLKPLWPVQDSSASFSHSAAKLTTFKNWPVPNSPLRPLPAADGPATRPTTHASSCATRTGRRLVVSTSRTSQGDDQRRTCDKR